MNSIVSMKYFTVVWQGSSTRFWVFLYKVHIQELFYKTKIWARLFLRKIQSFKIPLKYFAVVWPDSGTQVWMLQCHHTRTIKKRKYGTEFVWETFRISRFWWNIWRYVDSYVVSSNSRCQFFTHKAATPYNLLLCVTSTRIKSEKLMKKLKFILKVAIVVLLFFLMKKIVQAYFA